MQFEYSFLPEETQTGTFDRVRTITSLKLYQLRHTAPLDTILRYLYFY